MRVPKTTVMWLLRVCRAQVDAKWADCQPMTMDGLVAQSNPYGQATVKMPDGRFVDRFEIRRQADILTAEAVVVLKALLGPESRIASRYGVKDKKAIR